MEFQISLTATQIHNRAIELCKQLKFVENELLDILLQAQVFKVYLKYGYSSMFEYCRKGLGLSEGQSCYFISVMRKSREVPQLKQAIEAGKISVSQARRIVPVVNQSNHNAWIEKAATLTQRELEFQVAKENPKKVKETVKPVSEDKLEMRLSISKKTDRNLQEIRKMLIQKRGSFVSYEQVLDFLTEEYLEKSSPVKKAERAMKRNMLSGRKKVVYSPYGSTTTFSPSQQHSPSKRVPISASTKHQIVHRSQNRCEFVNNQGHRCEQNIWLEMHHVKPVSEGGSNALRNLKYLCSSHHRYGHN